MRALIEKNRPPTPNLRRIFLLKFLDNKTLSLRVRFCGYNDLTENIEVICKKCFNTPFQVNLPHRFLRI